MSELRLISDQVARLLPIVGTDSFVPALVNVLREWVLIDEVSMIVYPASGSPAISHREHPMEAAGLETFLSGPFLLDPYYVAAARESRYGFFSLKQLAPRGFKKSEYYRVYYRYSGLIDECGYLVALQDGGFINLSLARTEGSRSFERPALRLLDDLNSMIAGFLNLHFQSLSGDLVDGKIVDLRAQLEGALMSFGHYLLTPREQQIINAILHGHTSKALASVLGISVETVKLHRKNAYRKLAVRNQTELFHAFIKTLKEQNPDSPEAPASSPTRS